MVGKSEFCDLQKYQDNNVELSVFSFSELQKMEEICKQNSFHFKIHIKINSGMNRLGVKTIKEFNLMQNLLKNSKNLEFCGLFTHFCSIKEDKSYFEKQKKQFGLFVFQLIKCSNLPFMSVGVGQFVKSFHFALI